MFLLSHYLTLCSLLPTIVISLALNIPPNPDGSITLTNPSSLVNASAATDNSTIKDVVLLNPDTSAILTNAKVDCDERRFGNPPAASCSNAVAQIPQGTRIVIMNPTWSYGPREAGTWDVNLPKRYISCKTIVMAISPSIPLFRTWLMPDSGWAMHYRSYSDFNAFPC